MAPKLNFQAGSPTRNPRNSSDTSSEEEYRESASKWSKVFGGVSLASGVSGVALYSRIGTGNSSPIEDLSHVELTPGEKLLEAWPDIEKGLLAALVEDAERGEVIIREGRENLILTTDRVKKIAPLILEKHEKLVKTPYGKEAYKQVSSKESDLDKIEEVISFIQDSTGDLQSDENAEAEEAKLKTTKFNEESCKIRAEFSDLFSSNKIHLPDGDDTIQNMDNFETLAYSVQDLHEHRKTKTENVKSSEYSSDDGALVIGATICCLSFLIFGALGLWLYCDAKKMEVSTNTAEERV